MRKLIRYYAFWYGCLGTLLSLAWYVADLGNFNYGAMGAALGIPGSVLLRGAGVGTRAGRNFLPGMG